MKDGEWGGGCNGYFRIMAVDLIEDMEYLLEYLKVCWRLLYRADMLMKECGIEAKWDAKILRATQRWGLKGKHGEEWWANDNAEGRDEQ